jgi:hypothetical protein
MTSIGNPVASLISQTQLPPTPQANQSTPAQPQGNANAFGDAVNVSLSPPAQTVVANQKTASTTSPANGPTTPASPPPAPATPSVTVNVAALISAAKQKVIPQVGVSGANDVVDSKGNISKVQLAIEINEQAQKA